MCKALAPFKGAVDTLASKDAYMLLSEKIIACVLKKLGKLQSSISKDLIERFSVRIDERRNDKLVHLFEYLWKPSHIDQPEGHLGHKVAKKLLPWLQVCYEDCLSATNLTKLPLMKNKK